MNVSITQGAVLDTFVRHSYLTLLHVLTWHFCPTFLLDSFVGHCANANVTAATQITDTDTSSANAIITAGPQIARTDTSCTNAKISAASRVNLTHFRDPFRKRSPLWRALRRTRRELQTVVHTDTTFGEHSLVSRPPKWNGNHRYAFGKNLTIA